MEKPDGKELVAHFVQSSIECSVSSQLLTVLPFKSCIAEEGDGPDGAIEQFQLLYDRITRRGDLPVETRGQASD